MTVDLSLYSYNPASGSIAKYSNNFNDLILSLSSNTGQLNKNSVKLGEKFTFTPFNQISSIDISVLNVTTTLYFIKDAGSYSGGDDYIIVEPDNLNNDSAINPERNSQFVNQIVYSPDFLSYGATGVALDKNISNQSNVNDSIKNPHSNNDWLIFALILLIAISGVLIWKYKDKF